MASKNTVGACPCGTGTTYDDCCGRFHRDLDYPKTAIELMRSRYSAFVKEDIVYLNKTWASKYRPVDLSLDQTNWIGLKIVATEDGGIGDSEGWVEFIAKYKVNGKAIKLHERSHFILENGRWVYAKAC
jgi:SEC-C motif-containing protein